MERNTGSNGHSAHGEGGRRVNDQGGSHIGSMASRVTSNATEAVSQFGGRVTESADRGAKSLGETIESTAGTIRQVAGDEGMMGPALTRVADTLETSGRYLKEKGLNELSNDVAEVVRRKPMQSILSWSRSRDRPWEPIPTTISER